MYGTSGKAQKSLSLPHRLEQREPSGSTRLMRCIRLPAPSAALSERKGFSPMLDNLELFLAEQADFHKSTMIKLSDIQR